jgi:DHA2 family multidrug resistance protein-like MFS transporter
MTVTESAAATTSRRQWIGLAVLSLATLLVSLDLFVMLLAVPAVTEARPALRC